MDIRAFMKKVEPPSARAAADAQQAPAPAPEPAPPPAPPPAKTVTLDRAPKPTPEEEQQFIDYFNKHASVVKRKGTKPLPRRARVFGKQYTFDRAHTSAADIIPEPFQRWLSHHGFGSMNSFVVQVYDNEKAHMDWHSDKTNTLSNSEVAYVSFALNKQDRAKKLSDLEFRWPDKAREGKYKRGKAELAHGTIVRFDAKKHMRKRCEHRVAKTIVPRVSVAMRSLV